MRNISSRFWSLIVVSILSVFFPITGAFAPVDENAMLGHRGFSEPFDFERVLSINEPKLYIENVNDLIGNEVIDLPGSTIKLILDGAWTGGGYLNHFNDLNCGCDIVLEDLSGAGNQAVFVGGWCGITNLSDKNATNYAVNQPLAKFDYPQTDPSSKLMGWPQEYKASPTVWYLRNDYNGEIGFNRACYSGWLSIIVNFCSFSEKVIPWYNATEHFQDWARKCCNRSTSVPSSGILKSPAYPMTSIEELSTLVAVGSTTPGATDWKQYKNNSLYLDLDTGSAGFAENPIYFTSLVGDGNHWRTTGATSIYSVTPTGFRVYVFYECGAVTPEQANLWGWHVRWIGVPRYEVNAGSTIPGATNWVQFGDNGLFVDVNTGFAEFTETPIYITSLGGNGNHWRTTGATSIYNATPSGFRLYVFYDCGAVTPKQANLWGWHVQWIGIE